MSGWTVPQIPRWLRVGVVALTVGAAVTAPTVAAPDDTVPIPAGCSEPSAPDPVETVTDALLDATWIRCEGDSPLFAVDGGEHVSDYARWRGESPEPGQPVDVDAGPCGPLTPPLAVDDVAAARNVALGTWIRCDGSSIFAAHEGDDVGLELTADGHFFRVYDATDRLIRAQGVRQEGRWVINDVYTTGDPPWSSMDLGLKLVGSGYSPFGVSVHNDGRILRFTDSMSGTISGYSRWSGPTPTPGLPAGVGTGACGHPTRPVQPSSSDELVQLLVGPWAVCAGELFGPGIIGVEFLADGSFRAYARSTDGQVVVHERSVGATWRLWPFDEPFDVHNGPQIDVVYVDGSTRVLQPEVFSSPRFMSVWPDSGLLAGTPQAPPGPVEPLPPTGTDVPTKLLLLGGTLVVVGALTTRRAGRTHGARRFAMAARAHPGQHS